MQRIHATYLIETPLPLDEAAATIAGEQSSGTFVAVPGETDTLKRRFGAHVDRISPFGEVVSPSLPGCKSARRPFRQAEVIVSWPLENVGFNVPALISTLQGNLYELSQLSGIRLIDVELPDAFAEHFIGPRFGVAGTRELTGLADGPLIGTIVKPSVGLSPDQTAKLAGELAEAGIDFIKDDELMANPPHSPFARRVEAVMEAIDRHADRTGKRVMYAFNVTDELDAMLSHYDSVVAANGTCVMVSVNSVGWSGVKRLCDQGAVPVHAHRNGWGMLTRHPMLGMEFRAYQKLWRLAGVDHIHVNGIANKFWEADVSVVRSIEACRESLLGGMPVLPVVSSGQWGGQAFETYCQTRTTDLLYLAGGGIMAHPDGPAGGVKAIRDAWSSAVAGETIDEATAKHKEFRHSVDKFGG